MRPPFQLAGGALNLSLNEVEVKSRLRDPLRTRLPGALPSKLAAHVHLRRVSSRGTEKKSQLHSAAIRLRSGELLRSAGFAWRAQGAPRKYFSC
jgi:hypothetical protein